MKKIYYLKLKIFALFFTILGHVAIGQQVIHYYNLNNNIPASNQNWPQPIAATIGGGDLTYTFTQAYSFAGSTLNGIEGEMAGGSFAARGGVETVNNGAYFKITAPTSGFQDIILSYAVQRTSTGFTTQDIEYTLDGNTWQLFTTVTDIAASFAIKQVDFSGLVEANDNSNFAIRVVLTGATSESGNNRFDNIKITGNELTSGNQVATPLFNPSAGAFTSPVDVTITTATEGAAIYYTTDGNDPSESSNLFTDPINISSTLTLKARAFKDGMDPSNIATASYSFPIPISTIAELRLQQTGTTRYALTDEAILTFEQENRNQKFIQDETAGILIDDPAGIIISSYNIYDGITGITGTLSVFGNMLQFTPVINPGPATSINNQVTPVVVTLSQLASDFDTYESRLVTIENVEFVTPVGNFVNGQVYAITDGTITANFRTTFYDVDYIGDPIPSDPFHLTALPNARAEGNYLTARFESDFNFDLIGTDASLSVFTLGGLNSLNLGGVVVDDPAVDEGATLFVTDFIGFAGIVAATTHPAATYTVTLNGTAIEQENLADQVLASDDVVVVTVVAEDEETTKIYKVTLKDEIRSIVFTLPIGGEAYETGDPVTITWTSENITTFILHVYKTDLANPVAEYPGIPAADGTFTENLPNGAHGEYYFRLSDAGDLTFYAESETVTFIDTQAPEIFALMPANNAVNVAVDATMEIWADEELWAVSGKFINIHKTSDNSLVESIEATSPLVTIDGNEVHFSPTNDLAFETTYYVLVDEGAFVDMGNNPLPAIASGDWAFTTQVEPVFELICNGDFENWTAGKPDCWFGSKTNLAAASVTQYTENPQSGNSAVRLMRTESTHQRFTSQPTTVENGKVYKITFWLKGKGSLRTGLFDDRPGNSFGYAPYNVYIAINSNIWQEHTQYITALNNSSIAEFIFSLHSTDPDMNHIQLDNVTIEEVSDDATQLANLLALRAGAVGAKYQVTGQVVLTFKQNHRNQKYVQDASAAILIDDNNGVITTNYNIGDGITGLTGTLVNNSGMLQLAPTADPGAASSTGNAVVPEVRTLASLTSADQAKLVKIENVTFANASGNFATSTNYDLSSANGTGVFRTSFFDADYIGTPVPSAAQTLTVLVNQYLTTIQVAARSLADFEVYTSVPGIEFSRVSIYPNPFRDHIRVANLDQVEKVRLLNSSGQVIAEFNGIVGDIEIGTSGLKSGLYFIQLIGKNGSQHIQKLIRQ
jgi:sulfur carrier protein ThiS